MSMASMEDGHLGKLFGDGKKFNDGYRKGTVQELRRNKMFTGMMGVAYAAGRAANLVMSIIEENEDRMQMDDAEHLLITGTLAIYPWTLAPSWPSSSTPDYNSFDVVEVHPKSGLVKNPRRPAFKFSRKRTCQRTTCWPGTSWACSTMKSTSFRTV